MALVCGATTVVLKSALVAALRERAAANPWLQQTVVVSSGASRQDLAAALVHKGPVLGVEVMALWSLAQNVVDCQGKQMTAEHPLHALKVLQADPLLEVGAPDSGFSGAFTDLLSAGLDAKGLPALEAALQSVSHTVWPIREKFIAACRDVLGSVGVRGRDRVLAEAARCVRAEQPGSRKGVHLYGFADATGLATEFLGALVERGATLWLEVPEGDAARLPVAAARRHVTAFAQRVAGQGAGLEPPVGDQTPLPAPTWICFTAPDATAEAEEVALRVHALLRAGTAPHRIAIVLTEYDGAIGPTGRALNGLDIPFHVRRSHAVTPLRRAALLLARTLRNGRSAHPVPDALDIDEATLTLAGSGGAVTLAGLEQWMRGIADWLGRSAHGAGLEVAGFAELAKKLRELADGLANAPDTAPLRDVACTRWLARALEALEDSAGNRKDAASGVQVLSTALARGLSFEHAFLVGAGRGFWPRTKNHGAVLPREARRAAQQVLPHLAADEGGDELAHLFIQMLHLAPQVTISWARGGGKERGGAAPWVLSALALSEKELERHALRAGTEARLESALERHGALGSEGAIVLAGLREDAAQQAELLVAGGLQRAVALERQALLDCFEGRGAWLHRKELSPWHGRGVALWGPKWPKRKRDEDGEPLSDDVVSPTRLEALAGCGWKLFLQRGVSVGHPVDPMESEWSVSPMDRGSLVHNALDALVKEALALHSPLPLSTLREFTTAERIDAHVSEALEHLRADARIQQRMAWANVDLIRERELTEAAHGVRKALELLSIHRVTHVIAAEQSYPVNIDGLKVKFKADLEAKTPEERVFVDWKTGRNPADLGSNKNQYVRHFARGTKLQTAIYSTYQPQDGLVTGAGAYAYVSSDFSKSEPDRWQEASAYLGNNSFIPTMHALHAMLLSSNAPPRVAKDMDGDAEGDACRFCDLSRVCVLGDSRQRWLLTESARQNEVLGTWWRLAGSAKQGAPDE